MAFERRRRARWMGPAMAVLAGMAAGAPALAGGIGDGIVEIPEWRRPFVSSGVTGTVVVRRLGETRSFVSDIDGADRGLLPASTFKIPHLLIALETGVVQGLDQVYPWDGQTRPIGTWNADRSVRDAVRVSSVPVFQDIARSIGADRMSEWLVRLRYGNAEISGGVDRFWLDGGLRVTPVQQVDFVERMLLGTLPAATRSQIAARDAVPGEALACDGTIHAKSGWARPHGDDGPDVGWWVGWVERPREVWMFATAVEGDPDLIRGARRNVTMAVLEGIGVVPAAGECPDSVVSSAPASGAWLAQSAR